MGLRDVVSRGHTPVVLRSFEVSAAYHFEKGIIDGIPWLHTGGVALRFTTRGWTVGAGIVAGGSRFDAIRDRVRHIQSTLKLGFGRAFPFSLLTLTAGVYATVTGVWQTVSTRDETLRNAPEYAPTTRRNAWLPAFGADLTLGIPLTERLWMNLTGSVGPIWVFMADSRISLALSAGVGLGLGWRF